MSYSLREVSAMLGLSPAQIRGYASKGFLEPERGPRGELRFGFHDLIILRTAGELTAARIPQRKVRRVLEKLREQLPEGSSLTGVRITADGERVIVRDGEAMWNPESGQSLFDFAVSEIAQKTKPFLMAAAREARERSDEMSGDDWYELACELEISSHEQARDAYERALRADPEHADAHVNLGRLFHEEGAPAAAEPHYRAALEADPEHETAAFNLGVALEDLGRIEEAIRAYKDALALDDQNADAHYNLAGIYERRGEKQAALRHLKVYRSLTS
ncbi:MAG TPA: tetratricopeptide repeat protein [Thermoanaerobaculia bacterium]|jgi:tetratricopeptide (TPR) repeat protein|nr:tetratricopeptide repeat protein [Thermoanaerobaculia bacterium]